MKVVTSNLEQRSYDYVCKRYKEVMVYPVKANHTRNAQKLKADDPNYCTDAGTRDMYDYKRANEIYNFLRELVGLSPVPLSKDKQIADEMEKAVIRGYRGGKCETKEGRRGLSSSITNYGNYEIVLSENQWWEFMNAGQFHVPSRRQLIDPAMPEFAADGLFGYIATRVRNFNTPPPAKYNNPEMIAYPSPGYYPGEGHFYSYPGYWSITLRDYDDLPQDAVGTVTCEGKVINCTFRIANKTSTVPKGAFLFDLSINRPTTDQRCVVSIKSKQEDTEWRYWTEFVDCIHPRRTPAATPIPDRTSFPEGMKLVDGDTVAALNGGSVTGIVFGFLIVAGVAFLIGMFVGKKVFTYDDDIVKAALV